MKFQLVRYTDSNGFEKPAVITGTRKSVQKGTEVPRPERGCANLAIFSPLTGKQYTRTNIPQGEVGQPLTWRRLDQEARDAAAAELSTPINF